MPPPPAENSSKNIHSTTAGNTSMLVTERVPNVDWKRRRMEREGRLAENERERKIERDTGYRGRGEQRRGNPEGLIKKREKTRNRGKEGRGTN